ncbi:anti-sigma-28 factor, FlgM family [Modicisalibacter ilicicola DSM 19980]|uniref:Negative regulator of flagellin synthesis n=1 Tax=Modicisalibacter ilicicola DSM 19980 TaxID=1121942 RepID=A0A1M4Z0U2_9GAMM|nr:flagellar biosynthesis anti-sigma factor FlgM [Halomonas ilicicola]SHF11693.1 anti-sigma-28 factor, FlgM family [Halomonas ilicicola DSM 19980]
MKIDSTQPLNHANQSEATKRVAPAQSGSESRASSPASVTHLSTGASDTSHDVDAARVAELRQAISEGRLDIRPERIADGLIDSVRDLLDHSS